MSATTVQAPAPVATPQAPTRSRKQRRWHRLAIPFGIFAALWTFIVVAHSAEEPTLSDPGTMSPTGTGPDGSSELARELTDRGITITTVTSSLQVLKAAAEYNSTVFVPAPGFVAPNLAPLLATVPGRHRIVYVRPDQLAVLNQGLPLDVVKGYWATRVTVPDCIEPSVRDAGPAAVRRSVYGFYGDDDHVPTFTCYDGSVTGLDFGPYLEAVVVGATDPFRNSRFHEVGNAALATGLLSKYDHVIWLDLHSNEPRAKLTLPKAELPQYRRGEQDRSNTGSPMIDAFPPALWAILLLGIVVTVLLGVARARRLGPPVAEPLPVLVPAAEAVTGRGRLYHRIAAREAVIDALRTAGVRRLVQVVYPYGGANKAESLLRRQSGSLTPAINEFVGLIASRSGLSESAVIAILYGVVPADDDGLANAIAQLDQLVHSVLRGTAPPAQGGTP